MSINPLDHPGTPFDLELMNPNPTSSKTKSGPVYRVSFEVQREAWDQFMDAETGGMIILARATVYDPQADEPEAKIAEPEAKPVKGPYSEQAKMLHQSGFFFCRYVAAVIGTDQEYQDWTRRRKCVICGGQDWLEDIGEGRCEYAHVRRSGDAGTAYKPPFTGVPMCHAHHKMQHDNGESAAYMALQQYTGKGGRTAADARAWFERRAGENLAQWAHETLVRSLGYESLTGIPPSQVIAWAQDNGVDKYLPPAYGEAP